MKLRGPYLFEEAGSYKLNSATLPIDKAVEYMNASLDTPLPNFEDNYVDLQNASKKSLNIKRVNMPVIKQKDLKDFYDVLYRDGFNPKWAKIKANKLKPIQSQIWLDKLIEMIQKNGVPKQSSKVFDTVIIISKSGYIIDGHHRWALAMLIDPSIKIKVLQITLDIKTLLKAARAFSNQQGNERKK